MWQRQNYNNPDLQTTSLELFIHDSDSFWVMIESIASSTFNSIDEKLN